MKSITYALNVFFNNRFHVMLMPAVLTSFWNLGMRLDIPLAYYVMICLNTGVSYLFNLKTDKDEDEINYPKEGRIFTPDSKITDITIWAFMLISLGLGFLSGWKFVLYGTVLNFLGLAYGLPLAVGKGKKFRVKSVWWLKNAYSSLFWSVSLLVSPYIYIKASLSPELLVFIPAAFCMAFFVELLWDVRDIEGDEANGVYTIPVKFGEKTALRILHLFNIAILALCMLALYLDYVSIAFLVVIPQIAFCLFFLRWYMKQEDKTMGSHFYLLSGGFSMLIIMTIEYFVL